MKSKKSKKAGVKFMRPKKKSRSRLHERSAAAPLATYRSITAKPTHILRDDGMTCEVSGTEYMGPLSVTNTQAVGDVILSFPVNPCRNLSRLSSIASTYEKFKFKKLVLHYVPIVPATQAGSLILAYEMDPDDMATNSTDNVRVMMNNMNNVAFQVSQNVDYACKMDLAIPYLFCEHIGHTDLDVETRTFLQGVVQAVWNGTAPSSTTIMGSVYIEYEVEFRDPQLTIPIAPTREATEKKPSSLPLLQQAIKYFYELGGATKGTYNEFYPLNKLLEGTKIAQGVLEAINIGGNAMKAIKANPARGWAAIIDATFAAAHSLGESNGAGPKPQATTYPATVPGCYYMCMYVLKPDQFDADYWPYTQTWNSRYVDGYVPNGSQCYIGDVPMTGSITSCRPSTVGTHSWTDWSNDTTGTAPIFTPGDADTFSDVTPSVGQTVGHIGMEVALTGGTRICSDATHTVGIQNEDYYLIPAIGFLHCTVDSYEEVGADTDFQLNNFHIRVMPIEMGLCTDITDPPKYPPILDSAPCVGCERKRILKRETPCLMLPSTKDRPRT